MAKTSMKAFVTGATGFVGSHVARLLEVQGADLRLLTRSSSRTENIDALKAERVIGDLRLPDAAVKATLFQGYPDESARKLLDETARPVHAHNPLVQINKEETELEETRA